MHSCELVVPPPAQGAALLLELGTLIIEGRGSKVICKSGVNGSQNQQASNKDCVDQANADGFASSEASRGALPKRPAPNSTNSAHLSPAKRNRDQVCMKQDDDGNCENRSADPKNGASTSELSEGLSVYDLKARLANIGGAPLRGRAEALWRDHTPLCIEVLLAPSCGLCRDPLILVERWTMSVYSHRAHDQTNFITSQWLLNAVRSQLHFSQISAWDSKMKSDNSTGQETQAKPARDLSPSERQRKLSRETCNIKKYESNCDEDLKSNTTESSDRDVGFKNLNVVYNLKIPDETFKSSTFNYPPTKHSFPVTDIGSNIHLEVHLESLPRLDDIPTVKCLCSNNNSDIYKRRRSKDQISEVSPTEDILARKLNVACSLTENNSSHSKSMSESDECTNRMKRTTFSPELGIINSDMGCSSGISRKFPLYSSSHTTEFGFHTLSSRGSTPDRCEFDSGSSCSKTDSTKLGNKESSRDPCLNKSKEENSYHDLYNSISNIQVPSDKLIDTNYSLVDDRMQTPCRQSGKHRCNCDDESDQGNKDSINNANGHHKNDRKNKSHNHHHNNNNNKIAEISNEKRTKDGNKFQRKLKKDNKPKQDCRQSSHESSECKGPTSFRKDRNNDLNTNRKIRTCSSSDNSEGRSSPELVHYRSVCNNCYSCMLNQHQDPSSNSKSNSKHTESTVTTSIPILQASKFDHVNRFGNFRSAVSLFGPLTAREFYSLNQQQNNITSGCDQMGSIISACSCQNQDNCSNQNSSTDTRNTQSNDHNAGSHSHCYNERVPSDSVKRDDDYRPSVKKLISSYTQTDDTLCDCGRSLIPICFECNNLSYLAPLSNIDLQNGNVQENIFNRVKMKRSEASHNLAAVDKSSLFLEALEKTWRIMNEEINMLSDKKEKCDSTEDLVVKCHDSDVKKNFDNGLVVGHDEKVIDYNCDNSVSTINNCECDKRSLYSNKFNNVSCTNDSLSHSTPLFSCSNSYDSIKTDIGSERARAKSDLSICINESKPRTNAGKYSEPKSAVKKLSFNENSPIMDSFFRKPKLKRFASSLEKIEKVMVDRNRRKIDHNLNNNSIENTSTEDEYFNDDTDDDILYKDEETGVSFMTTPNKSTNKSSNVRRRDDSIGQDDKEHIIVYDRGDYGTFGETKDDINKIKSSRKESSKTDSINVNSASSHSLTGSEHIPIPSVTEMDKFRLRLDSAASMVFHSRNGLPLTSSPAPLRRGKSCFDYDSSINSVSSIKSALYGLSTTDLETQDPNPAWSPGSSPGSPSHALVGTPVFNYNVAPKSPSTQQTSSSRHNKFRHGASSGLLGSFEESVLNGRLEPAATVAGFTAQIGASGEFWPSQLTLPVTVFFYSLGDNTTSAPYLGHINLGRRGYCVPRAGTIQVTLFNPHGTVVKMFVVMYDLGDMPPHSRTFLRQRTLWGGTCLRYLIHLRFLTSKSGKVYLHTDIRIIVSRKADLDTAVAHSLTSGVMMGAQKDSDDKENEKKARGCKIETGTFERRPMKDKIGNGEKKLNRSNACYELSTYCNNNNIIAKDDAKKYINQNHQSPILSGAASGNLSTVLSKELSYELRSFTYGPENPKYSPR